VSHFDGEWAIPAVSPVAAPGVAGAAFPGPANAMAPDSNASACSLGAH
jgi:hypothetical protein